MKDELAAARALFRSESSPPSALLTDAKTVSAIRAQKISISKRALVNVESVTSRRDDSLLKLDIWEKSLLDKHDEKKMTKALKAKDRLHPIQLGQEATEVLAACSRTRLDVLEDANKRYRQENMILRKRNEDLVGMIREMNAQEERRARQEAEKEAERMEEERIRYRLVPEKLLRV